MKYIAGLNGIRAIAVFLVVLYHWGLPPIPGITFLNSILPDGKFGVNMFFVLSGFLITTILLMEKQKENYQTKTLITNFYIRRSLRIFPVYYLCVFILSGLNLPNFHSHIPFYLTYTENFHVYFNKAYDSFSNTWSLAVEEQFYLIWPFIILFTEKKKLPWVMLFFIFLGPAFSIVQTFIFHNGFYDYILTPDCFDAFGIGGLIGFFYKEKNLGTLKRIIKIALPFAILFFFYWKLAPGGGHAQYLRRFFDSIISAAMILFCLSKSFIPIRTTLLENKIITQLGIISYGVYLFHYPIPELYSQLKTFISGTNFTAQMVKQNGIDYILMMMILLSISFLSYYIFELPILKLKNRFAH